MKPILSLAVCWLVAAAVGVADAGESSLRIWERRTGGREVQANLGDTLTFDLMIDTRGEQVVGLAVFLTLDDRYLDVIPQVKNSDGTVQPFAKGSSLTGTVLKNSTRGDVVGQSRDTNGIPGFQLDYEEFTVPPKEGPRPSFSGQGIVASFSVRVIRRSPEGSTAVSIDEDYNNSRSTAYFVQGSDIPNRFRLPIEGASIRIIGFRLSPFPDVNLAYGESRTIDLDGLVEDPATPDSAIAWQVQDPVDLDVSIDSAKRAITISPRETSLAGEKNVVISATNSESATVTQQIRVTLTAVPVIGHLSAGLAFDEDASLAVRLDDWVDDADDPDSTLLWTAAGDDSIRAQLDQKTRSLTMSAPPDWSGEGTILLTVSDPHGRSDSTSVGVIVRPVNDPPRLVVSTNLTLFSGGAVRLPLRAVAFDPDTPTDRLVFTWSDTQRTVVSRTGSELVFTAPAGWSGEESAWLKVTDGEGQDTTRLRLSVLSISLPHISVRTLELLLRPARRDTVLFLDDFLEDADTPDSSIRWSLSGQASRGIGIDAASRTAIISAPGDSLFLSEATLTATDPDGGSDSFVLRVIALPAGVSGPVLVNLPTIRLAVGGPPVAVDLAPCVVDAEYSDELLDLRVAAPASVTASMTGQVLELSASPDATSGQAILPISVSDPAGRTAIGTIRLVLFVPGQAPIQVKPLPEIRMRPGSVAPGFDLDTLTMSDRAGSELAWSFSGNSRVGILIDPSSHVVTFASPAAWIGRERVRFTVYDPEGATASREMTVVVFNTDIELVPTLQLPEKIGVVSGGATALKLDDYVTDLDNDVNSLTWSLLSPPGRIRFALDSATRSAVISAPADVVGAEWVSLRVVDPDGRFAQDSLLVFAVPLDGSPVAGGLSLVPIRADGAAAIDLGQYYFDADNTDQDMLWLASSDARLDVRIDNLTQQATLKAKTPAAAGIVQLVLTVVDPDLHQSQMVVRVAIEGSGPAPAGTPVVGPFPVLSLPGHPSSRTLQLDPYVTDDDTPDSLIAWQVGGSGGRVRASVDPATRSLTVSSVSEFEGSDTVVLFATDRGGLQASAQLTVTMASKDTSGPVFAIGLLINPILSRRIVIYVTVNESLPDGLVARVDGTPIDLQAASASASLYVGQMVFRVGATSLLEVEGQDSAGNKSTAARLISVSAVSAKLGGVVSSPDGLLDVLIQSGNEGMVVLSQDSPIYFISGTCQAAGEIRFKVGQARNRSIEYSADALQWTPVPTSTDAARGLLTGRMEHFGAFRVMQTDGGSDQDIAGQAAGPEFFLLQNSPNPFNGETKIGYYLPVGGMVELGVYDVLGQRVASLFSGDQGSGRHSVVWDGCDDWGRPVATGAYFYKVSAAGSVRCRRLIVVR